MMNTTPPGWSDTQLQALNDLGPLVDALNTARTVSGMAQDYSAGASQVQADLLAMVKAKWATVTTYPQADA